MDKDNSFEVLFPPDNGKNNPQPNNTTETTDNQPQMQAGFNIMAMLAAIYAVVEVGEGVFRLRDHLRRSDNATQKVAAEQVHVQQQRRGELEPTLAERNYMSACIGRLQAKLGLHSPEQVWEFVIDMRFVLNTPPHLFVANTNSVIGNALVAGTKSYVDRAVLVDMATNISRSAYDAHMEEIRKANMKHYDKPWYKRLFSWT